LSITFVYVLNSAYLLKFLTKVKIFNKNQILIMKKFILSFAVIAAIGFTSCSSDDDNGGNDDNGCVTCDGYEILGQSVPAMEVCEGENGNAFVQGEDTETAFDEFIAGLELITTCD